jgi:hypothetical protein
MSFDPSALASLSPAEFQALLEQAAAVNPEGFRTVIKGSSDIKRLAKQAVGTGGSTRTPSFLEPIWPAVLVSPAMLEALGIESGDDDLAAVLSILDSKVEGSQEACTLSYESDGRTCKVRITVLSENNSAQNTLDKALQQIEDANATNFEAVAKKYRKRVSAGRVDSETRKEMVEQFDNATAVRKAALEGDAPAPPAPPAPPGA